MVLSFHFLYGFPVDIQAARSPLPLKQFRASKAVERTKPIHDDKEIVEVAASDLVGESTRPQRNIIAVGLRACYSAKGKEGNGPAIMELAEALNAPVLTRLDAKGVVDELHPLSFGVVGVHGKPGMEVAASLISSSDRVICIGVDDETLLVCNLAGLQIRKVVEIEPDAFGISTRFEAEHTLVGPIDEICRDLALSVETKTVIRNRKEKVASAITSSLTLLVDDDDDNIDGDVLKELEFKFGYMSYMNPSAVPSTFPADAAGAPEFRRYSSVPNVKTIAQDSTKLWDAFHSGNWQKISKYQEVKWQTDLTVSRPGFW
jgi:thiamine pyrophosphate-dependent acetolactate synthase large subunit-like protein